jgi:hypothetical protein
MNDPTSRRDGARFLGTIQQIGDKYRASCGARIGRGGTIDDEVPDSQMFATRSEARKWIEDCGARRGFGSVRIT